MTLNVAAVVISCMMNIVKQERRENMKCIIESAHSWKIESFIDKYAKTILNVGFALERLDEDKDNDAKILIELSSMEDLRKLADAIEYSVIFVPQRFRDDIYPTLIIYDDYMEC